MLHIILFAVLIWSSFDEHIEVSAGGGGSAIDAGDGRDPGAVVQQSKPSRCGQQASARRAEEELQKRNSSSRGAALVKQAAEQERVNNLRKNV